MNHLTLPMRNLWRRPSRSFFAAVGVAMAVAIYASMTVLFGNIVRDWEANLSRDGVHALVLQDRQVDWLASSVPETLTSEIEALEPVLSANGELLSFLTTENGTPILATGWSVPSHQWNRLEFVSGGLPRNDAITEAVIGESAAAALGIATGNRIDLDGLDVTISGVFRTSGTLMDSRLVMPLAALQAHMFRNGTITYVQIALKRPGSAAALAEVTEYIKTHYPGLAVRPTEQLGQDNRIIELLSALSSTVIWIAGIVGIAGTANIMMMAVNERRTEIGLLIAVGWSQWRIAQIFMLEAVILASLAGLAGIALGFAIIEFVSGNAALAAFLSTSMTPGIALRAFAVAVVIGTVSGVLPAVRAARVPADITLRSM